MGQCCSSSSPAPDGRSTTSTVVNQTVTGSHVLKVDGYCGTKGLGVGKWISSGAFSVGGHSWCIRYYPDGHSNDIADWICVDLCRLDGPGEAEARARFKHSILNFAGEPVYTTPCSGIWTFSREHFASGYLQFIKRIDLETSPYVQDDCLRIRCDVTVIKKICTTTTTVEPLTVPPSDLQQDLGDLLDNEVGGDVKFEVGGEVFTAHRNVLAARSPVFMAELFGPMKEEGHCVRIDDMEPGVFEALLGFIYTDSLPEIIGGEKIAMAQHLLVAADRYNMERLKLICEVTLHNNIDRSTVATTLVLAEQHGCRRLKEACLKFIASPCNLKIVMSSDGFEHVTQSCPSLFKELAAYLPG